MLRGEAIHKAAAGLLLAASLIMIGATDAWCIIVQGDFTITGYLRTQWSGRWGEGSTTGGKLTTFGLGGSPGVPGRKTGGSFDFNHWDLVQARTTLDLRPGYRFIKNYNLFGRIDTLFIKDADLHAIYRGWYDAFPDFKPHGVSEPNTEWPTYNQKAKEVEFQRDDLREYYAQLNVTDRLGIRIGKQQIIWTEADALSGNEVVNPVDLRYHFVHFESPEELRIPIQMVKMNYTIPDFWNTASNELEAFWIPGDFQKFDGCGASCVRVNAIVPPHIDDERSPYFVRVPVDIAAVSPAFTTGIYNEHGQPVDVEGTLVQPSRATFGEYPRYAILGAIGLPGTPANTVTWLDLDVTQGRRNTPSRSLSNSEFGVRYSTLLPIGSGLQVSIIYEWLYRAAKIGIDPFGPAPPCIAAGTCTALIFPTNPVPILNFGPGIYGVIANGHAAAAWPTIAGGMPASMVPITLPGFVPFARSGFVTDDLFVEYQRSNFFGLTGTYYDKDITDVVFRYDFSYRPKFSFFESGPDKFLQLAPGKDQGTWSDGFTSIIAFDRPTYIPWLSKQHTFIVAQYTLNWYPRVDGHTIPQEADAQGKQRKFQNWAFVAVADFLWDGRLTTTNAMVWDVDDTVGALISTNAFRYTSNILMAINVMWYVGVSGRFTDPLTFSRDQRINEVEARFTYEL